MMPIDTALAGMQANRARLTASASNIANIDVVGPVPAIDPVQPISRQPDSQRVYQAVRARQAALAGGGTVTSYAPVKPSYVLRSDPVSAFANANGMVAAPNVDLADEMVAQLAAKSGFQANALVLSTAQELDDTTFTVWG